MRTFTRTPLLAASLALVAAPLFLATVPAQAKADKAEKAGMPEMTPEQMAEMDAYMKAGTPGAPHQWLATSVGTYDVLVRSWNDPAAPPTEDKGTATRKMILGGRVLVEDMNWNFMGQPVSGQGMAGYENVTGKYWSTWMDSMSTGMMKSEGSCDASHVCTYKGSWTDPVTKKLITARMVSRWTSPTTETFEMYSPGKDGKEMKMMEILYTKK